MKKIIFLTALFMFFWFDNAFASENGLVDIRIGNEGDLTSSLQIMIVVGLMTIAPSLLIMVTCFTQVVIVLGLTRQGLGTMALPPNQVMIGLALFITAYIMMPVFQEVDEVAYTPYKEEKITFVEAFENAEKPIKHFMVENTYEGDLMTFLKLRNDKMPKEVDDVSIWAAIPSYALSQISKGLFTGMMVYMAFTFIDLIVASILMFMGMIMLPPPMISLPIKILVFVFVGGFSQIVEIIFQSIKV